MNRELKHTPAYDYQDKQNTANLSVTNTAKLVAARPRQAEEVPTKPIALMELATSLQPGISVHSINTATVRNLPAPLVAQPSAYRRNWREWFLIWWDGIRPAYLTLSLLPILLGTTLAWTHTVSARKPLGQIDLTHLIGGIIMVLLIQIGGHLVNDYYDYVCGIDTGNVLASGGLIQQRHIQPKLILKIGLFLLSLGAILGLILSIGRSNLIYFFGPLLVLGAYFYSAPPYPLSSIALGEITGFVLFGPFLTLGAYMAQTGGSLNANALAYSLPPGLLALAVIHTNNLRDSETDANARKMTTANLMSIKTNRIIYLSALLTTYGIIGILGIVHNGPHPILITFWTLPLLVIAISGMLRTQASVSFHTIMRETLRIDIYFMLLLIIGLVMTTLVPMLPHLFS